MSRLSTYRRRLRRAAVVAATVALALLGVAPVPATAASDGQYILDIDAVELDAFGSPVAFGSGTLDPQTGYSLPGQLFWYRNSATGRLRGELLGR